MTPSDTELLARVRERDDHQAFGELVARHQSAVRRFLHHLTRGDGAWADDLAQDAFVHAYRKVNSFRAESSFATWVMGIAHNLYRNARRQRRNEPMDTAPEIVVNSSQGFSDLQQDLEGALAQLSGDEQAALHLCFQQGLSHTEAARVLEIPVGTLKTLILRSKERLRNLLVVWNPQT